MVDFAFCLGRDCKTVALKHNDFVEHGANNLLLGRQLILSCLSTPCLAGLVTSRRILRFKESNLFEVTLRSLIVSKWLVRRGLCFPLNSLQK